MSSCVNRKTGNGKLPLRPLGKTGYKVGIYSLGAQGTVEIPGKEDLAEEIINRAIDLGINYIDTAAACAFALLRFVLLQLTIEMKKSLLILIICFPLCTCHSQEVIADQVYSTESDSVDLTLQNGHQSIVNLPYTYPEVLCMGFGCGFDYGGLFGTHVGIFPQKNIGIFGAFGYALNTLEYNAGLKVRSVPKDNKGEGGVYATLMYGYNTIVIVKSSSGTGSSTTFYGLTGGLGVDMTTRKNRGYWSFGIMVPFREKEALDYVEDLKRNHNVTFKTELWPIGFSLGYKAVMN